MNTRMHTSRKVLTLGMVLSVILWALSAPGDVSANGLPFSVRLKVNWSSPLTGAVGIMPTSSLRMPVSMPSGTLSKVPEKAVETSPAPAQAGAATRVPQAPGVPELPPAQAERELEMTPGARPLAMTPLLPQEGSATAISEDAMRQLMEEIAKARQGSSANDDTVRSGQGAANAAKGAMTRRGGGAAAASVPAQPATPPSDEAWRNLRTSPAGPAVPAAPVTAPAQAVQEPRSAQKSAEKKDHAGRRLVRVEQQQIPAGVAFNIKGSERLRFNTFIMGRMRVVDIAGEWRLSGDAVRRLNRGPIQAMRIGVHKDKLRLVFDYTGPERITPEIVSGPQGLTIRYHLG